jgi:gliding motility-associated-like protein
MRYQLPLLSLRWIPVMMLFLGFSVGVNAQCSVTVTNPLPNQIVVGNDCMGLLDWSPEPVFSVMGIGCSLTSATLTTINSGPNPPVTNYTRGQMLPAGTTVFVTYQLNYMENGLPTTFNYNFTIFFVDEQDPVFTSPIPPDVTVNCTAIAPVALNATDNCSGALVVNSVDNTSGYTPCGGGTIIRTWTATDASLNSTTATQTITVMPDLTAPTFNIAMPVDATVACDGGFTPLVLTQGDVSDNCGAPVTINLSSANTGGFTCPAVGRTIYTWTITDACNNSSTHSQTVTFVDNTAPVISAGGPNMATISCNNSTDPVVVIQNWAANNLTVNDNCDNSITWTNNFTSLLNGCSNSTGTANVTFTATDGCNTSTRSIAFTVVDNTTPTITNNAQHLVVNCNIDYNTALTNWLNTFASATATDACSNNNTIAHTFRLNNVVASVADIQNAFATSLNANACGSMVNIGGVPYNNVKGLVTVEFVFTDLCLNAASTMASFAVQDNSAPVFVTPAGNQTMACTDIGTINTNFNTWLNNHGNAVASDACTTGNLTWYAAATGTFNIATRTGTPPSLSNGCGETGSSTVDFYVEDVCGNITQVPTTATFTVTDTNLPTWTVNPTNLTVECNGTTNPGGQITTWLAANGNGTATDGCSGVTYSNNYSGLSNGCGATGTAIVIFSATDACGNTATSTATVTIVDTNAPVWGTNPSDLSVVCNAGTPGVIAGWLSNNGGGSATDACGTVTYTNNYSNTSGCSGTGSVVVIFTATDECGLSATRTATLMVTDNTPPTWTTNPNNLNVNCTGNNNSTTLINNWLAVNGNGVASDICGTVTVTNNFTALSGCGGTGSTVVVFTASDACNNTATATATVTVTDNTAPSITTFPIDLTIQCDIAVDPTPQIITWLANQGGGIATDGCSNVTWSHNYAGLSDLCGGTGFAAVTFTASDACGNTATDIATVSVVDIAPPVLTQAASNVSFNCENVMNQSNLQAWINFSAGATVTDACGTPSWSIFNWVDQNGGIGNGVFNVGPYPIIPANDCNWFVDVTFTALDECSNPRTTTARFSLLDAIAPVFTNPPGDITVACNAVPAPVSPSVTDNCDASVAVVAADVQNPGSCPGSSTIIRTYTATDDCNNATSVAQTITIIDNVAPVLAGIPIGLTVTCNNIPAPPVIGTGITASDICDVSVNITFNEINTQNTSVDSCNHYNYSIIRTWTATDDCSNSVTVVQTIFVQDINAPSYTVPSDITVSCEQVDSLTVTGSPLLVVDNCDMSPDIRYQDSTLVGSGLCNDYTLRRTWNVSDACGNANVQTQTITVIDNTPPSITTNASNVNLVCTNNSSAESDFDNFIATHGGATAADNCNSVINLIWFAMMPGSYDLNNPATFSNNVGALDPAICPAPVAGLYRIENVDFIVIDQCGNANVTSATFRVEDNTPPVLVDCPVDITVTTTQGFCEANLVVNPPVVIEECGSTMSAVNATSGQVPVVSGDPGSEFVPVNTIALDILVPALPVIATGNVNLALNLYNTDTEQPTEYFRIYSEDGTFLGQTEPTPNQCSPVVEVFNITNLSANQINNWSIDGVISFSLEPNIPNGLPATFAVNDICPGAYVEGVLTYDSDSPNGLVFQYQINSDTLTTAAIAPISYNYPVGTNSVTYYVTDCSGNTSSCAFNVVVDDIGIPTIACPSDISVNTALDLCTNTLTLPLPAGYADACGAPATYSQTMPTELSDALLTFTLNPNYLEYIADDKTFAFTNTAANAVGSSVKLIVNIQGDVNDLEELYTIYGEDGGILGTTEIGQPDVTPGSCTIPSFTTIDVPASLFNTWAADGTVYIIAISKKTFLLGPPGGAEDGINPCTPFAPGTPNGSNDGSSRMWMTLQYAEATPSYFTTGATVTPLQLMQPPALTPELTFNTGVTTVHYVVTDQVGNTGECTFDVIVTDNQAPQAGCLGTTIFVNPSGVSPYTLDPSEIEYNSIDNCGSLDFTVTPAIFNCEQQNSTVLVTLTATDATGNTDTCIAPVRVETLSPDVYYNLGICGNEGLYLSVYPPPAQGNIVYTYQWSGPDGFVSNQQFPIIEPATSINSGSYTVTVSGLTGCTSVGTLQVEISDQPNTPLIFASDDTICAYQTLILSTQAYTGAFVQYYWYSGVAPFGFLMGTSFTNQFFNFPFPGDGYYYVVVEVDGCFSAPSSSVVVNAAQSPVATVNQSVINICEGEDIILGTSVTGSGITYNWTGPNGFVSNLQFPSIIDSATIVHGGEYQLIVSQNGCPSVPVFVSVNVTAKPERPLLVQTNTACEGSNLILSTNIINADLYQWMAPNLQQFSTPNSILQLNNITGNYTGNWTLTVDENGCSSDPSLPLPVIVHPTPVVTASNNGPVCQGASVTLSASSSPAGLFNWSGPGLNGSILQNPFINPAQEGDYTVVVTTAAGCSGSANTSVELITAPIITGISDNGLNCADGSSNVTMLPTIFPIDNGTYLYTWTNPDGSLLSNSANAVIANATTADNGTYMLVVENEQGCTSEPVSHVINLVEIPTTPIISVLQNNVCEGALIEFTATPYDGNDVVYNWSTPLGLVVTTIPSLSIAQAIQNNDGVYTLSVTVNGCTSLVSNAITLDVVSTPAAPVASGSSPLCEGSSLNLSTPSNPGYSYEWTGPNFSSTLNNPVIPLVTPDNEGCYKVRIITPLGCVSPYSQEVCVTIIETPATPVLLNNSPVCVDANDASLDLSITPASQVAGASYTWYDGTDNSIVGGPSQNPVLTISDLSNYNEGLHDFYAITTFNGCNSLPSVPTTVTFNEVPGLTAFAGNDTSLCGETSLILSAQQPGTGTGLWSQLSGPALAIANPGLANSVVNGLTAGNTYVLQWSLSNGSCTNYATDEVTISVSGLTQPAEAGDSIFLCNTNTVNLNGNEPPVGAIAGWTQPSTQSMLGVVIEDPTDPNTQITGLEPGNTYIFYWSFSNDGCGNFSEDGVVVSVTNVSDDAAYAGEDFNACGDGNVLLNADEPVIGNGLWSSPDNNITIVSPMDHLTNVLNLSEGQNIFYWTLSNQACGVFSIDTIIVGFESAPIASNDAVDILFGGTGEVNVVANDIISGLYTLTVVTDPNHGQATVTSDGSIIYQAAFPYAGDDILTYQICSQECPDVCATANLVISIGKEAGCTIPTIITPNGDGVNDAFVIPCLASDGYPDNKVTIFNQWGDEVYTASPYANDWEGTYNGEPLPTGTYYFIVEFASNQDPEAGFLIIER